MKEQGTWKASGIQRCGIIEKYPLGAVDAGNTANRDNLFVGRQYTKREYKASSLHPKLV